MTDFMNPDSLRRPGERADSEPTPTPEPTTESPAKVPSEEEPVAVAPFVMPDDLATKDFVREQIDRVLTALGNIIQR